MVVLTLIALLWLGIRVAVVVLWVIHGLESDSQSAGNVRDALRPQDATDLSNGPQDAVIAPQDAVPAEPERSTPLPSAVTVHLSLAVAAALWRKVLGPDGAVFALKTDPGAEWRAALRETISQTVPRPTEGPACLGGRDDAAYLRGWDDAADWIGAGHDAEAPTWAGVAYMTGWNDAIRDLDRARRGATTWPTPGPSLP